MAREHCHRVDPDGGGDPGVGVLAHYLARALTAEPDPRGYADDPQNLWPIAERVMAEVDQARAERTQIDTDLEEAFGGLL